MTNKLIKGLIATAVLAALAGCNSSNDNNESNDSNDHQALVLTVAHINDTHSQLDAKSGYVFADINEDGEADKIYASFGGYPRLAKKIAMVRETVAEEGGNLAVLHGGDAFQGSMYFTLNRGQANADLLSDIGLDAMTIGNHEFDLGNEALADFVAKVSFPILAANMDASGAPDLDAQQNLKRYIIKEYNGEKVGIFGLVLEGMAGISSPGEDIKFMPEIETAQKMVDELQAEGVNKIIMVSHIGVLKDQAVAKAVNGIDLIVGGHSHSLLEGDDYAQQVSNADGSGKTCIVQAGELGEALGLVEIKFTAEGKIESCGGGNVLLASDYFRHKYDGENKEQLTQEDGQDVADYIDGKANIEIVEEDADMRAKIDTVYKPVVEAFNSKVVAQVSQDLGHVRIPGDDTHGSQLAPLVAEAFYERLDVDFTIQNAGSVRIPLPQGDLTAGKILGELMPFGNTLVSFKLSGEKVRETLEYVINSATDNGETYVSDGSFPYVGHMRYTYLGDNAKGERITVLDYKTTEGEWVALENDKLYSVGTNAYIAGGKDNYIGFTEREEGTYVDTGFKDNDAFLEYAEKVATLDVPASTGVTYYKHTN